ncbi:MAG: hypothetical protein IK076_03985 [Bacteroidales bacterium]|nr:hypothetical protein [Bacteroidales bacterium]
MKRTSIRGIAFAAALLALASCAPQAFVIRPEMRGASKSGLNLNGKSIAVVYVTDDNPVHNDFSASMAGGFASRLEEDYFGGAQAIELFKMPYEPGVDYSNKDSLVNLVMESGKDVVFLFDVPGLGAPVPGEPIKVSGKKASEDSAYLSKVKIPFSTKVYVYDSMNKDDKVLGFTGNKELSSDIYTDGKQSKNTVASAALEEIKKLGDNAGYLAANTFLSSWIQEVFYVIYYEGAEKAWNKAAASAFEFKWDEAIEGWITLLGSKSSEKRAWAAYNIALGCFMSGQPGLALEWLDRSDKDYPVSLSKSLRSKIKEYTTGL